MSKYDSKTSLRLVGSIKAIEQLQEKNSSEGYLEAYFYLDGDNKSYKLNIDDSEDIMREVRECLGDRVEIVAVREYPSSGLIFPEENAFIGIMTELKLKPRVTWKDEKTNEVFSC